MSSEFTTSLIPADEKRALNSETAGNSAPPNDDTVKADVKNQSDAEKGDVKEDKLSGLESDATFTKTAKEKGWGSSTPSGARFN